MIESLQVKIKTLASEAKSIRFIEQKKKRIMDWERQVQPKMHKKDEPKPVPIKYPEPVDGSQERHDEAYDKFWNLHHHRVTTLRREARLSLLAYAFLRGLSYKSVEETTHDTIHTFEDRHDEVEERGKERRIFAKVKAMAKKFFEDHGDIQEQTFQQKWAEWIDAAREHILAQHPLEEKTKQ